MLKYGLLVDIADRKTNKIIKIYKPIYSNNLKELQNIKYKLNTEQKIDENTILEIAIFDYQKCCYVKD